jgi:cytosine/adenosine deaminase-related metal-dependent hydrolase
MSLLIENVTILQGTEFDVVTNGWLSVDKGRIQGLGETQPPRHPSKTFDGKGLLALPGLIDAHIHLGDAAARDLGNGRTLRELVDPIHGLKTKLLKETPKELLSEAIRQTTHAMLASGITAFADFREGGSEGVRHMRKNISAGQHGLILGRPNYYFPEDKIESDEDLPYDVISDLKETLQISDGLGVSGPNEYTNTSLHTISDLAKNYHKQVAIHVAESELSQKFSLDHFGMTEVARVFSHMTPGFMIHLTHATSSDLEMVAEQKVSIVCCPQANASLGLGVPPMLELLKREVTLALGTDNVMLNEPDMFSEMNYVSKLLRTEHRNPAAVTPRDVLKMATSNAAKAIGLNESGSLEVGKKADIVFLNLNHPNLAFSHDPVASIVHRAHRDDIVCVMIEGEIRHGLLKQA